MVQIIQKHVALKEKVQQVTQKWREGKHIFTPGTLFSNTGSCKWGKDFGLQGATVQLFDFLGIELHPATFLHCFLEATEDRATVYPPISPVTWGRAMPPL